jgi:hypothetical protein
MYCLQWKSGILRRMRGVRLWSRRGIRDCPLDKLAKPKVEAVLRRASYARRTAETAITVLLDGEDGLRGVGGWVGSDVSANIVWTGSMFHPPSSPVYGCRLAFHSRNLNRIKRQLWNSGIEMAEWGMRIFRAGLGEDPGTHRNSYAATNLWSCSLTSCGRTCV